jgi:hypothetical protein
VDSAWAPVVAVLIGVLASPITTFALESYRRRQAIRDATFRFQRETLDDLQEMLRHTGRHAGVWFIHAKRSDSSMTDDHIEFMKAGLDDVSHMLMLTERVMDQDLRNRLGEIRDLLLARIIHERPSRVASRRQSGCPG